MNKKSMTLFGIEKTIKDGLIPFKKTDFEKNIPSFYLRESTNPKYVQPLFSELFCNNKEKQPKIILISAAGATGKTELSNYLSSSLQMPVFNLSEHAPVASNSLTGLFFECLGHQGIGTFIDRLHKGNSSLIIDALDEGYLKTTTDGFNSFLREIADICRKADSTCFVLLGRTQIVEHCALYFDESGVDTQLLAIESFTIDQAKEFINKQLNEFESNKPYKLLRDFIVNSIEGFFKNQSEVNKNEYKSFIGYAPVLLSICKLLEKTTNYQKVYEDLSKGQDKGIDLIITIMDYILLREKEEKIQKLALPSLLEGRDKDFCDDVTEKAYSIEEQCFRLVNLLLNKGLSIDLTSDLRFNRQYEDKIVEWLKEHPFLEANKIQNSVFESYMIAKLILNPKYEYLIYEYLRTKYKDAFMLFFVFDKLNLNRNISASFFPFLYNSLKSLDDKFSYSSVDIEEIQTVDSLVTCEVEFSMSDREVAFTFQMTIDNQLNFNVGRTLSNAYINAQINILMEANRCELKSPITILCRKIIISANELVIEKGINDSEGLILECSECEVDYSKNSTLSITSYLNSNKSFRIVTEKQPEFPLNNYFHINSEYLKLNTQMREKCLRLSRIIALFRSHSKGRMGRFKDKIDNPSVIGHEIGLKVLKALLDEKILYLEGKMYFINPDNMHSSLGLSYNEIRLRTVNEKTMNFLNKISNLN